MGISLNRLSLGKKLKTFYFLVIAAVFVQAANSQVINIPDANFKAKLLAADESVYITQDATYTNFKVDANNNGEIEVSEALQVYSLYISDAGISDLTGLEYFLNIEYFDCSHNNITTFDGGQITFYQVECDNNQLTSIDLAASFESLFVLDCSNNNLTTLEVLRPNGNHGYLFANNNQLTDINITGDYFYVQLENNAFTSLDLGSFNFGGVYVANNQLLTNINIKNGFDNFIDGVASCPNLQYICVDDNELDDADIPDTVVVNSYCTFTPGGTFYVVEGATKYDAAGNGCDAGDLPIAYQKFTLSDGTSATTIFSDVAGVFAYALQDGTHTITPVMENTAMFVVSPASVSVSFPADVSPSLQSFCVAPNGIHNDVSVALLPIGSAVPGFDANYLVILKNEGNQIESGTVSLAFDDMVLDFVSSSEGTALPNAVSIAFTNLQPFEARNYSVTFNLNSPMETPALNGGDMLTYTASATTDMPDATPGNNSHTTRQMIMNSFDPNHKTCVEGATISPSMVGEYVHYVVQFENVGTFPATNIVVKDLIDTAKYDLSTLVPVSSSHSFTTRITETNKVEFIFEGINLPIDDANNDGYVAFKIKTKPTLALNDTFSNTASIYFDYNFPIITNTETTTIATLASTNFDFNSFFTIYPNPVNGNLTISKTAQITISTVAIFNMLGQQLIVIPNADSLTNVDVSSLGGGTYFLKITSDHGSAVAKFIKQ